MRKDKSSIKGELGNSNKSVSPKEPKGQNRANQEDDAPGVQAKSAPKDSPKGFSRKNLEKLFAKYKDETAPSSEPVIGPEGLESFCSDLEISSDDVLLLVVAYHLNAQEMGYFTQVEFIDGFEKLGLDSIETIRQHVHSKFKAEMDDPEIFKAIYRFAFFFAKEDLDKKVVDMEIAAGMLSLVMSEKYPLAKSFVEFLKQQDSYKALNLDQWMSFYEFCKVVNNDFSKYDENSAWPCIIDEWVEWKKKADDTDQED